MCRQIDRKSTDPSGASQSGGSVSEYGGLNVARRGPGYTQTRITSRIIAQILIKSLQTAAAGPSIPGIQVLLSPLAASAMEVHHGSALRAWPDRSHVGLRV